jgi:hypothetical protein
VVRRQLDRLGVDAMLVPAQGGIGPVAEDEIAVTAVREREVA